jgi:hypothetical protein
MTRTILAGHVVDHNGKPVAGAQIAHAGKVIGKSARDGRFKVTLAAEGKRIAVTFTARDHMPNTRLFDSRVTGGGTVVVVWPITNRVTFDARQGLAISFGRSGIRIRPGTLIDRQGKPLGEGAVLEFTLLDVTNPSERPAIPGDFKGLMRDRSVVQLNSFGVFQLSVLDRKGRAATLAHGETIDLSIAVPEQLAPKTPKAIPYFDFDGSTGNWVEVGSFEWAGSTLTYNGHVERFGGPQNLDDPTMVTCVTIRTVDDWFHNPLPSASVTAHLSQSNSYGVSNASGYVCLLVERNAPFSVTGSVVFGGSNYVSIAPMNFMAPNIQSGAADCGDPVKCPYLGDLQLSLVVGLTPAA